MEFPQATGDLDEVLFHALLNESRYEEAFSLYLDETDARRFRRVFGDSVDEPPGDGYVPSRFIVSQAGPGDEIMLASTYNTIRPHSGELLATCDPRLEELFSRSFPDIEFLPVERGAPHRASGDGSEGSQRPVNPLHHLLTVEAHARARASDRVVPGRSLGCVRARSSADGASEPFLQPDPMLVERFARRWRGRQPVGIAWRSEMRSHQRDIHYLTLRELAPVLSESEPFVCLQYDATEEERADLVQLTSGDVIFVDDVDLRNDFSEVAALLATLSAVVGVGTTTVELSAAVGTPTVMLQPTHFGSWRGTGHERQDYWHRAMQVMPLDDPERKDLLAERGRNALRGLQESTAPSVASAVGSAMPQRAVENGGRGDGSTTTVAPVGQTASGRGQA
jgi:capsular polysaccharide export protein